jgi:hypothetical protein
MNEAVSPSALQDFLAVVFYLCGGLGGAAGFAVAMRSLLRKPSSFSRPVEVEMVKDFATKQELQKVDDRVTALDESVDERFAAAARAGAESREKLYNRINIIDATTAALKREAELQSARQLQMDGKLDRILERQADSRKV